MQIYGTNALNLDFTNNFGMLNGQDYRLDDNGTDRPNIFTSNIQFSRTSNATYFDRDGLIKTTPASKNLYTWSQNFENSAWTKSNCSVSANQNPFIATLGPELVTNGTFDSGVSGWSRGLGSVDGTFIASGGVATYTVGAGDSIAPRMITAISGLTVGANYRIQFDEVSATGTGDRYVVWTATANGTGGTTLNQVGAGSWSSERQIFYLQATATPMFVAVGFLNSSVGSTLSIDNISVREVISGFNIAPDNTPTADTLIATVGTSINPNIQQTVTTVVNDIYTASFYVRPDNHQFIQLAINNQTSDFCNFTLTGNGTVQNNGSAIGNITYDSNTGYYRISMAYVAAGTDRRPILSMVPSGTATRLQTWNTTGNEYVTIWGAQFEVTPNSNITLGSELITNGDFSAGSTGWTLGTGWSISDGQAVFSGTVAANFSTSSTIPSLVANLVYIVEFDVSNYVGSLNVRLGNASLGIATVPTNFSGKYQAKVICTLTNGNLLLRHEGGTGGSITIDNISVKLATINAAPTTYTSNYGGLFPPRIDYTLGYPAFLIESQRTNLVTYSEQFGNAIWTKLRYTISSDSTVSPDGTTTADTAFETTTTDQRFIRQTVTFSSSVYTISAYIKGGLGRDFVVLGNSSNTQRTTCFNIFTGTIDTAGSDTTSTITNVGNGWYRCSVTVNVAEASAGVAIGGRITGGGNYFETYTGDATRGFFVWGVQIETGPEATSYIPTVASQVTRASDIASVQQPIFGQMYRPDEGTFVARAVTRKPQSSNTVTTIFQVNNNTNGTAMDLRFEGANLRGIVSLAQAQRMTIAQQYIANAIERVAFRYRSNDFALVRNNSIVGTNTSLGIIPIVTQMGIGQSGLGSGQLNGWLLQLTYIPFGLPNAQLQQLTA